MCIRVTQLGILFLLWVLLLQVAACEDCATSADCSDGEICRSGACQASPLQECNDSADPIFVANISPLQTQRSELLNGPARKSVTFRNVSNDKQIISRAKLWVIDNRCASFELAEDVSDIVVSPGDEFSVVVNLSLAKETTEGCACHSAATLSIHFGELGRCHSERAALTVQDNCEGALQCSYNEKAFQEVFAGDISQTEIVCMNISGTDVTATEMIIPDSRDVFSTKPDLNVFPTRISFGESISLLVQYSPQTAGEDEDTLVVVLQDHKEVRVRLYGSAQNRLPSCAEGLPVQTFPGLQGPDYTIVLETEVASFYPGLLRSSYFYAEQPPLVADLLMTTGSFTDPLCEVSQSGHQYLWHNCDPAGGTIHNIHALPHTDEVDEIIRRLRVGDEITVYGYEIDRINYANNSYWTDAGCNSLIVMWVCQGTL